MNVRMLSIVLLVGVVGGVGAMEKQSAYNNQRSLDGCFLRSLNGPFKGEMHHC